MPTVLKSMQPTLTPHDLLARLQPGRGSNVTHRIPLHFAGKHPALSGCSPELRDR